MSYTSSPGRGLAMWHRGGNSHLPERGLGTPHFLQLVCINSLRGEEIGKRLFDSLTSHSLPQAGKYGEHCAFLDVEMLPAMSCASRMCFLGA